MALPGQFPVSMHSYLVREHIPRHSVSYHLSDINIDQCPTNLVSFSSIYALTKSRLQCGLVIALSTSAFVLGIVTTVTVWGKALKS
jgi:hypothetical protein